MENVYVFAGVIAVIYGIFKFIEMRFIEKEARSIKLFVRDTLFVYISVIAANFAFDQIQTEPGANGNIITNAFTGPPAF